MYQSTLTDKIWNRACIGSDRASTPGDSALEAMISFHSVGMNGGVLHAIESFTSDDLEKVKDGYQYFGIVSIAELINAVQASIQEGEDIEALEDVLDHKYSVEIPDDATLCRAFEAHYKRSPESYAPLSEQ
jgi:hypothetical protein